MEIWWKNVSKFSQCGCVFGRSCVLYHYLYEIGSKESFISWIIYSEARLLNKSENSSQFLSRKVQKLKKWLQHPYPKYYLQRRIPFCLQQQGKCFQFGKFYALLCFCFKLTISHLHSSQFTCGPSVHLYFYVEHTKLNIEFDHV